MTDERLKIWLGFAKFILGTFIIGVISTIINCQIQKTEVQIKSWEAETKYLAKILEGPLAENIAVRLRIAEFYAKTAFSSDARNRWNSYLAVVKKEYENSLKKIEELKNKEKLLDSK